MDEYLKRVQETFQNNPCYHTLYEIIVGKEDIAGLVEGQITPLSLLSLDDHLRNMESLEQFETIEDLKYHLDNVQLQEQALLPRLRSANASKPVEESCVCLHARPKSTGTISCYVCAASFHAECVTWNPFFDSLPSGVYLCYRCLRGKRPSTDSIAELKTESGTHSMEHFFVEHLRQRALKAAQLLQTCIAGGDKDKVENALIAMLSQEAVHYPTLEKLKEGDVVTVNDQDKQFMSSLKAAEGRALPRTLFASKSPKKANRKRSSTSLRRRNSKAKKSTLDHDEELRRIQNQENNVCEAALCIKPCSQEVNWIQCQSGCERWFHYVCIGLTIPQVSETAFWGCSQCPTPQ
uniref:PHD-type domain-containing protein n=1 Tax=Steinernema glaseri TaxID=37863 RepID=A0A1I7ZLA7_9BILA